MASQEQLEILKQGFKVWNLWREKNPGVKIDFSAADLTEVNVGGANLRGANLRRANLSSTLLFRGSYDKADLSKAYLFNTDIYEVSLREVDLGEADLSEAQLIDSDLYKVNLRKANLRHAYFIGSNLEEAHFNGAIMGGTIFSDIGLGRAHGLEEIHHNDPSTIGADTIRLSNGNIPTAFLRGCGFSDLEIETANLLKPGLDSEQVTDITYRIHRLYIGGGIEYYSCFISYSSRDEAFARILHDDLQNNGVRCWFAPEDMKIGD